MTPYLPVVNIRFNYSIFGEMWNKTWQPGGTSLLKKLGYLIFIGFWVCPLFLALPWAFKKDDGAMPPAPTDTADMRRT